jgi:hypothetical protein
VSDDDGEDVLAELEAELSGFVPGRSARSSASVAPSSLFAKTMRANRG